MHTLSGIQDNALTGFRFLKALPGFLRSPLSLDDMRVVVRDRFARREEYFLNRLAEALRLPDSPYARLMDHAGCSESDLRASVDSDGVEGTLSKLFRAGVYLAGDEFKGRRPVVRGSLEFTVDPASLVSPNAVVHGLSESSGSRGARTPVPIDLAFVRDHAVNTHIALDAHDGGTWRHAHHGVPGGTSVTNPLEFAKGGNTPVRWFTPVEITTRGLSPRYRWGVQAMRIVSRTAGVPFPKPIHAPFGDPMPILEWIADELRQGNIPHLWGFASTAVLVCQAACDTGFDIRGARFTMGGEPTTSARRRVVEAQGAIALPRMGATETDILSYSCTVPGEPDEMHFFDDRHALIQPDEGDEVPEVPAGAMLLTSLLGSAPVRLLNVCMGDRATTTYRQCGCGLEREGWKLHLHTVRSFEKLTAGGMTFLDVDVIRVLEEVLPARFGGRPSDWQVVEQVEGDDPRGGIALVVDPSIGPLDPAEVADAFLTAIGGGSGGERLMELQWRSGRVVSVVRRIPVRTASGKVVHVASNRRETSAPRE